jgi:hypothetical protein
MATEILRPDGDGDYSNIEDRYPWTDGHYEVVDEETPDDANSYLIMYSTSEQKDAFTLEATSIPSGATINSVKVYFRVKERESEAWYRPYLRLGSNETAGTWITPSGGQVWATHSEALSRPGGGSWQVSDLNSLQVAIGMKQSPSDPYCTQVYVEVDYTEVTEKESSDTGSGAEAKVGYPAATLTKAETGSGADSKVDFPSATLSKTETGSGADAKASGKPVASITKSESGSGSDVLAQAQAILDGAEGGSGADACVALEKTGVKTSSDSGSGVEGTSVLTASLAGSETGSGVEDLIDRLLAAFDSGIGTEVALSSGDKGLFAAELGEGIDTLVVKKEIFAGGEGTKFFGGGHRPPHRAS